MLPLLALGVGLASGAGVVAAAERKKSAKEADAAAALELAFQKEMAKNKAGAAFALSPVAATIREMELETKKQETLTTERAKALVGFEQKAEEQRKAQAQALARSQALGDPTQMSVPADLIVRDLQGEIPADAVFSYRHVNTWDKTGQPAMLKTSDGRSYMDVRDGHYIPKGQNSRDRLNNAMMQISGSQYAWWQKTNPTLAGQWKGRIGSLLEQAALDYTQTVDAGKAGTFTSRIPRIPESLAESLAVTYGPEFAIELIEDVYNDAQDMMNEDGTVKMSVKDMLRNRHASVYGMLVKPENARIQLDSTVNSVTNEAEISPSLADGALEPDLEGPYDEATRNIVKNIGVNINMSDAPHDAVVAEVHGLGQYNNLKDQEVLDLTVDTRTKFRAYDNYYTQSGKRKSGVFNIWASGTGTRSVETWENYRDKMGIFTKLNTDQSIAAATLVAPLNALDRQTPEERKNPRGIAAIYPYFSPESLESLKDEDEQYVAYIESTYLGGQKLSDLANKATAAKDTVLTGQALIRSYGQDSPAIPGFVGGAINVVNGFQAQFGYMLKAIDASGDSDAVKQKNREKITTLQKNLTESIANVDKTNEIAVANAVQKYYEGVLVYTMAMALQGGNAAARTISDADINRIENILSFGDKLGDTRVKVAVIKSVVRQMERQAKMGWAYTSKNEARVWAAKTLEDDMTNSGMGYKDFIFAAIEGEINKITGGQFYKQNPRSGTTIPLPQGGEAIVQPSGEIQFL